MLCALWKLRNNVLLRQQRHSVKLGEVEETLHIREELDTEFSSVWLCKVHLLRFAVC